MSRTLERTKSRRLLRRMTSSLGVLPVGACDTRPDYDYARDVELRAYGLGEGESFSLKTPTVQGTPDASYTVTRKEGKPVVSADSAKPFRAVLID